jgi:hypothetical protein
MTHFTIEVCTWEDSDLAHGDDVGGGMAFDWLDKCLIAADALLKASEDGIEKVIVTQWEPDRIGSVGVKTWTFDYDEDVNSRVVERVLPNESVATWSDVGALLASLEGVHV